jgi:hypothetical protein
MQLVQGGDGGGSNNVRSDPRVGVSRWDGVMTTHRCLAPPPKIDRGPAAGEGSPESLSSASTKHNRGKSVSLWD